jgi:phage I-like protein
MNHLILNREFRLPDDGWYHIAPFGEFPHSGACVIQVIDQEACVAMAARFAADAKTPNFPGLLVDFDHFSLDGEKRSEAAGWILGLENRENGLWAQIRWSDLGEEAVKGGRYRFLSPVWARSDCVDLGADPMSGLDRVRPVRILNAAVTNDPNLKGMVPLSNSGQRAVVDFQPLGRSANTKENEYMKAVIEKLVNHLGLAADATEAVILEKMGGLISATVVTELQNSLTALQAKHDGLVANLKTVEGELVNRNLADFEGVISEAAKPFWTEQLIQNRAGTLAVLGDLRELAGKEEAAPTKEGVKESTRKPLHNRATARPVPPGQGGQAGGDGDSKAVRIRNKAHEIVKAEKIPFGVAFRRAEREVIGQ